MVGVEAILPVDVRELRVLVPVAWQVVPIHTLAQASPAHEAVAGVDALVVAGIGGTLLDEDIPIDDAVFVRETVHPPRFRQTFTQRRSVQVVVVAGAVRLVDTEIGVPVKVGFEVTNTGNDTLDDIVVLATIFRLVLPDAALLVAVVTCNSELEDMVPGCSVLLEADVVLVNETVQPSRFKQALTHSKSVQVVVEANPDEVVLAGIGTPVTGGLVVSGLDEDLPDVVPMLGKDKVHPEPRLKQTFAHNRSVHVVVGSPEELVVVTLGNPVTGGELVADDDLEEGGGDVAVASVVLGPEMLLGKDTVQLGPRFKQAFTHSRSVHVADATELVVAAGDVPELVIVGVTEPGDDIVVGRSVNALLVDKLEIVVGVIDGGEADSVWLEVVDEEAPLHVLPRQMLRQARPTQELDEAVLLEGGSAIPVPEGEDSDVVADPVIPEIVDDAIVGLLTLGFGMQVGPIHRLRQSEPEHEGVSVKALLVVLEPSTPVGEEMTGIVGLARLEVDAQLGPIQVLEQSRPEQEDVNVLASRVLGGIEIDPADVMVDKVAMRDVAVARLDVHVGPKQRLEHEAPKQDVLEEADGSADKDVVGANTGVLLVVLPLNVGLVTVLSSVDEQPAPIQMDTDVVKDNDKLRTIDDNGVEEVGVVTAELGFVDVVLVVVAGHPGPMQRDTHEAPLQEVVVDWRGLGLVGTVNLVDTPVVELGLLVEIDDVGAVDDRELLGLAVELTLDTVDIDELDEVSEPDEEVEVKLVEDGVVKVLEVSNVEDADAVELGLSGFAEVEGVTLVEDIALAGLEFDEVNEVKLVELVLGLCEVEDIEDVEGEEDDVGVAGLVGVRRLEEEVWEDVGEVEEVVEL
ncbi:MAG: hypothetical protein Q9178_007501 [Gyalolechia marmorata]